MLPPTLDNYKNFEWAFPSRDIDPKKKGAEYCQRNAQAIYSLFCRNKMNWTIGDYRHFNTLRDYSRGEQSVDKYKSFLLNDLNDSGTPAIAADSFDSLPISRVAKRQGWWNVLWKNISPAPMILNSLHGQFDKMDFDLYVNVVDPDSRALEEEQAYLKLIEAQNAEWQNKIKMQMGIPIDEQILMPKSKEELDMMRARDGFKLNVARAMQKIVRYSFEVSRWDNVVRKKVVDDLITLGYGIVTDYFDAEDSKWKCEYVDPGTFVGQFSNETDYSDMEYCGQFKYVTISNLRNRLPDCPEDELKAMAGRQVGLCGNPAQDWGSYYSRLDPSTQTYNYDGFKVPVFRACWIDTNTQKKIYYNSKYGRKSIIPIGYDTEVKSLSADLESKGASQEVKSIFIRQPYECYWVIGTDYTYDHGPIKMSGRKTMSKPCLPYHVEQLLQPSIIDRLIPILDQIELTFLRYQNSLAMMIERGYAVNTTMLGNVTMGGNQLKPTEVIKLWKQTGYLLYQYSPGTGLYTGGAATPVVPIDGGMGQRVEETIRALEMWMKEIEHMTGINPVSLGGTPDPGAPVATTQAALAATANVLKPIAEAALEIKQSVGDSMMRRIKIGIRNSAKIRKGYAGVISPADMDALVLMEGSGVEYGLSLKAKPDAQQKMEFVKWIDLALQNVREQRPGIELPDAMFFKSQLDRGVDMNDLIDQMRYVIEKNKQEAQAESERMIQAQGEQNAQNEQAKAEAELAKIQAEGEVDMKEEVLRGQIKAQQKNMDIIAELYKELREAANAEDGLLTGGGR
jgi:hypothetical protein